MNWHAHSLTHEDALSLFLILVHSWSLTQNSSHKNKAKKIIRGLGTIEQIKGNRLTQLRKLDMYTDHVA